MQDSRYIFAAVALAACVTAAQSVEGQRRSLQWIAGITLGTVRVRTFAFTDGEYPLLNGDPTGTAPCLSPAGEEFAGAHVGAVFAQTIHLELHAEANTNTQRECLPSVPVFSVQRRSARDYAAVQYQGTTPGYDYITVVGRIVVEPQISGTVIRPRLSGGFGRIGSKAANVWQAALGVSGGSRRNRVILDSGEEWYRMNYVRVVRVFDAHGNITHEETQRGKENSHGLSIRIGAEHYF